MRTDDMVFCRTHKQYEPRNDLIDFPVSDAWLGHYYRIGLTPRMPPGYLGTVQPTIIRETDVDMDDRLQNMARELNRLQAQIDALKRRPPPSAPPIPPIIPPQPQQPPSRGLDARP